MAAFPKYTYKRVTTGTTLIKNGTGTLHSIIVNKALTGTITVEDGASVIAVLTNGTTAPLGAIIFDCQFGQQLQVVLSATEDATVIYE